MNKKLWQNIFHAKGKFDGRKCYEDKRNKNECRM